APARQRVVDPQAAEGGLELEIAGDVARDLDVLEGRGEHDFAGEELDVRRSELFWIAGGADPMVSHPHVIARRVDLIRVVGRGAPRLAPLADPPSRFEIVRSS